MNVNGREVCFRRTAYTDRVLANLSPGKDPNRFGEIFKSTDTAEQYDLVATLICAMSTGYENWKKYASPGYEPNPVSFDEAMSLDVDVFMALFQEAIDRYKDDTKQTVKTAPKNGQKKTGGKSN